MKPRIILASASPRRKELLQEAGYSFRVVPAQVEEKDFLRQPSRLVCLNARLKAGEVALRTKRGLILGADTLVFYKGKIYGKPRTRKQAIQFIKELQGKGHWVYTGVCLKWAGSQKETVFYEKSRVYFKKMDERQIKDYHGRINPMDKAGAYAVNEYGHYIVRKILGSRSNVIGLPMEKLKKMLQGLKEN